MHKKISYKLIAAVGSVAAILIGIFAYIILNSYQGYLLADLEQYAHQLSETVKNSTRYDMLLNQRESIHQIINTIGTQESIEKVRIFNKEGEIILSTDSLDLNQMVDKQAEACYACHAADQPLESVPVNERTRIFMSPAHNTRVLGIINPIYNEPSCSEGACHAHTPNQKVLGVLDITLSLDEIDRQQKASEMQLLILTVVAMAGISLIIYWIAEWIVLRPIGQVVDATRHVASGDLTHTIPVRSHDEIGALAKSFNDMTNKLAETQRQLFQSDKLASVGRLAAGVAHEINNPLTGVLTYSSLLLKQAQDDSAFKEDLEVIVRETKRCREIVKGLLDFARQSTPEKRHIHLKESISNAASIVQKQLSMHNIQLVLDLQEELPPVHADVNQLQQVLVNLFVNASDAMAATGGTITVETALSDVQQDPGDPDTTGQSFLRITVRDTGSGISAEHLDKIFDPFFTTKGQQGTGLGLAIVWGIIEEHNGHIKVESEVGTGTTFTILLPAVEA